MAWLSNWRYRRKITIDQTKVDADLTDFPIMIRIDSGAGSGSEDLTDIFDEIDTSNLKLAVTTSDGTTQCYVEVAYWDATAEVGVLFVKVPSVSGSADTELYIYYDNRKADNSSYVGVVQSTPAKQVWDDSFIAVYHFCEAPSGASSIKDSTQLINHGTPSGTPVLVDGLADKALDFERGDAADYITLPGTTERILDIGSTGHNVTSVNTRIDPDIKKVGLGSIFFNGSSAELTIPDHNDFQLGGGTGPFTWEAWIYFTTVGNPQLFAQYYNSSNMAYFHITGSAPNAALRMYCKSGGTEVFIGSWTWGSPSTATWYHVAISRNSNNDIRCFVDGTQIGSTINNGFTYPNVAYTYEIGAMNASSFFSGRMDEIRISDIARYTANFTPSTTAHASDSNTKLLLHGDPRTASLKGRTAATVESIFRIESYSTSGNNVAMVFEPTNAAGGYSRMYFGFIYQAASDMRLYVVFRDTDTGTAFTLTDPAGLTLDTWYHAAVTVDSATEYLRLYRNGSQVAENSASKGVFTTGLPNTSITIGAYVPNSAWHDGPIDEVRISGVARSAAWVNATYHSIFDALQSYDDAEIYIVNILLENGELEVQAYDFSMVTLVIPIPLGYAQAVFEAYGFTKIKISNMLAGISIAAKKPSFTCSGKAPALTAPSAKKPTATYSVEDAI
jgi:hypothetical protein